MNVTSKQKKTLSTLLKKDPEINKRSNRQEIRKSTKNGKLKKQYYIQIQYKQHNI